MSQSCFSLGFLSQNFLWKLSTFLGYKGIYSRVYEECKESVTTKQGILAIELATGMSREFESQANYLARLEVLSYSANWREHLTPPACFTRVPFWRLASCEPVARLP